MHGANDIMPPQIERKFMSWNFEQIIQEVDEEILSVKDEQSLEAFRIKYLGRKGLVADMYASLASASKEEKPLLGKNANILKNRITQLFERKREEIKTHTKQASQRRLDVTMPGVCFPSGHQHLLTQTIDEICDIFEKMGFAVQEGPEMETEFHNFDAFEYSCRSSFARWV